MALSGLVCLHFTNSGRYWQNMGRVWQKLADVGQHEQISIEGLARLEQSLPRVPAEQYTTWPDDTGLPKNRPIRACLKLCLR